MVQLSRPFQAIVAALALFVLVWFIALHRPGSTSTGSGSSSGSSGAQAPSHVKSHAATAPRSVVAAHTTGTTSHSATHAGGQTRRTTANPAPATAHSGAATAHSGAATPPEQHAAGAAHGTTAHAGAAATPNASPAGNAGTSGHTGGASHANSSTVSAGHVPAHHVPARAPVSPAAANAVRSEALQASVAGDLKHGRVVLLLFWNPHSSNDAAVHKQVSLVAHKLGRSVAAFTARASQVGLFGSITRAVQVYQTPTLLIVNPKRQVTTVTGLTDAYALEQTIREARG